MAREPRVHVVGGLYHVVCRGNRGQEVFLDDEDRRHLLRTAGRLMAEFGAKCYAYVLMPNHFQLLVQVGEAPLSKMMQRLLTSQARYFNERHHQAGHLFQGRFEARLWDGKRHLLGLVRYLHLRPVRAGLCQSPEEWEWSSQGA